MVAIRRGIAVEQRWKYLQRNGRRNEARIGGERRNHAIAKSPRYLAVRRQLFVLLHQRRLCTGGGTAASPISRIHDAAEVRHIGLAQYIGDANQHSTASHA